MYKFDLCNIFSKTLSCGNFKHINKPHENFETILTDYTHTHPKDMINIQRMIKDFENQDFGHFKYNTNNSLNECQDIEYEECRICGMMFFK